MALADAGNGALPEVMSTLQYAGVHLRTPLEFSEKETRR